MQRLSLILSLVAGCQAAPGVAALVQALDSNSDGRVSQAEVATYAHTHGIQAADIQAGFSTLDTNSNGELDPEELASTLAQTTSSATAPVASMAETSEKSMDHQQRLVLLKAKVAAQAGRSLAQVFMHKAEELLKSREDHEAEAAKLEAKAKDLRRRIADLVQDAPTKVRSLASKSAEGVAKASMNEAALFETQAQEKEATAAKKHQEANEALAKATDAQVQLSQASAHLRQ